MSLIAGAEGEVQIVFQPCVVTTRTAILPDAVFAGDEAGAFTNPYICKLHLTQ
jgi:hypothetical protein